MSVRADQNAALDVRPLEAEVLHLSLQILVELHSINNEKKGEMKKRIRQENADENTIAKEKIRTYSIAFKSILFTIPTNSLTEIHSLNPVLKNK